MVTRSRSSSFLNQEHQDCVDGGGLRRLGRISRSADGRFVLTRDSRSSSLSSTSDDGGFLSHPSFSNRTWSSRRPLMSAASVAAAATTATTTTTADGSVRTEADSVDSRRRPIVVATVSGPQQQTATTTGRPYRASSPTASATRQHHHQHQQPQPQQPPPPPPPAEWYFDLSSVVVPAGSQVERTLRSVHEQYSQQLPSLRVIHEENQRTLLMQQQQPGPVVRTYHPNPRFRSRHMRYARSAPELTSDVAPLQHHHQAYPHPAAVAYHQQHHLHQLHHHHHHHHHVQQVHVAASSSGGANNNERSPESRSSSSGFGSKNTSSLHPNDWSGGSRTAAVPHQLLPPYKPPPPPAPAPPPAPLSSSLFYANDRWMDLAAPAVPSSSLSPSSSRASPKPLSVDDQYEFDPIFPVSPTPTDVTAVMATARNTPLMQSSAAAIVGGGGGHTPSPSSRSRTPTQLKKAKYDNVEARLQAMKEEFYAYKRRQAEMARISGLQYVESAC